MAPAAGEHRRRVLPRPGHLSKQGNADARNMVIEIAPVPPRRIDEGLHAIARPRPIEIRPTVGNVMSYLLLGIPLGTMGFLMFHGVLQSLHTGLSGDRGGEVHREKSPFYFWLITSVYLISAAVLSLLGLLSIFVAAKDWIG